MPRLVALGDLVLDIVAAPARPLEIGTDVEGSISLRPGGSAANAARAFAALGGRATMVGAIGRDGWGARLAEALVADGVEARLVQLPLPTARIVALVDASGERSFITQRGAAVALGPERLRASWFRRADVLHLPAYSLLVEPLSAAASRAAQLARAAGALVSVDLSSELPLRTLGATEAWRRVADLAPQIVFANRSEAAVLEAVSPLLELAQIAVVKEGAAEAHVFARSAGDGDTSGPTVTMFVPTRAVRAADTTGAGDAFAAGFLFAWLSGPAQPASDLGRLGRDPTAPRALWNATLAGHRSARRLLSRPRRELRL